MDSAAQGKFEEAKEEFEKALKATPFLGAARDSLNVIEDVTQRKIERKSAIHLFKGAACVLKEQWDEGIAHYNKALELNPRYADAYLCRGFACCGKGQYDQAISDYSKAIELIPRHAVAYKNRAVVYYYKGKYAKAWEDIYKAKSLGVQIDPNFLKDLREASGRQECDRLAEPHVSLG